ncbi:hypothetical protein ZIOFF_075790 [Zingiber officinale]|uniref:Malic enzyme NAD-binding domain-containing protein n=1 Tax=Zingiber officinale TaxID=94328 RepID=A0A8J5BWN5_ZINOF|nr:hypothetical protein ZIOFF_075790 [Zingiber officinale]
MALEIQKLRWKEFARRYRWLIVSPSSQSKCNAEEACSWRKGQAIFASGSTFDPIEYDGKVLVPRQV